MVKKKASLIPIENRKAMIDKSKSELSICHQCDLLSLNRSTFYYTGSQIKDPDLEITRILDELYTQDPTRGTRRMSKALQRRGFMVGRQKARSLMQLMRIKTIYCLPRTTVIDPARYKYPYLLRNLPITHSNQVWALDISYIPMKKGYLYLLAIMDIYSRYIVGWSLSNTMEAAWVVNTLKEAVSTHGKPEIINSDQGSQFTSDEYISYLKSLQTVKISMDGKGRATDNAFIERFFRTIKYDKLYLEIANDGIQLYNQCKQFINYYNHEREHSELGYDSPIQHFKNAA